MLIFDSVFEKFYRLNIYGRHCVHPHPFPLWEGEGGGVSLWPNFEKEGRGLTEFQFLEEVAGKEAGNFFEGREGGGGCSLIKK